MLAREVIAKIGGNATRWMMLQAHYRAPLNINDESIAQAQTELAKVEAVLKQTEIKAQLAGFSLEETPDQPRMDAFFAQMDDDLNTPNGFMELFETMKQLNQALRNKTPDIKTVASLYQAMRIMLEVFGVLIPKTVLTEENLADYAAWNQAKADKDFAKADAIRTKLAEQGKL